MRYGQYDRNNAELLAGICQRARSSSASAVERDEALRDAATMLRMFASAVTPAPVFNFSADAEGDATGEVEAWQWLDAQFLDVAGGKDPNDRDYGPDDMVDAFIAGRACREGYRPVCAACHGSGFERWVGFGNDEQVGPCSVCAPTSSQERTTNVPATQTDCTAPLPRPEGPF